MINLLVFLTVNPRLISAAALIQNSTFLVRRLFEGGAYAQKDRFSDKLLFFFKRKQCIYTREIGHGFVLKVSKPPNNF